MTPMDNDPKATLGATGPRLATVNPNEEPPPPPTQIARHLRVAQTLRRLADMVEAKQATACAGVLLLPDGSAAPFCDLGHAMHPFEAAGAMHFAATRIVEQHFTTPPVPEPLGRGK